MEKVQKIKKIWLITGIASAVLGVASIVGIAVFAINLLYVPMAISIALTAHAFYGCPFYFLAFGNARLCERAVSAISEHGFTDIESIAKFTMTKPNFAKTVVEKCLLKGYLTGYMLDGDKLVCLEPVQDTDAEVGELKCRYCGTKLSNDEKVCSSCGAPNQ